MSARCWKILLGTISPKIQIKGATKTMANQLCSSPNNWIIKAVTMVVLLTTAILVPISVVAKSHSGFLSIFRASFAPREPLAASWRSLI